MSPLGTPQTVPPMRPPRRAPITLANWLTAQLGAQDEPGKWWIHGETLILQSGVGKSACYFAQRFSRDGGCCWEREFATDRDVKQFVRAAINTDTEG